MSRPSLFAACLNFAKRPVALIAQRVLGVFANGYKYGEKACDLLTFDTMCGSVLGDGKIGSSFSVRDSDASVRDS